MAQQGIHLPSGYGGLMRYQEEYKSRFKISPVYVIIFIILIIAFVVAMKIFWPVSV